jgi:squalene-hopene/tetraprenyl-beta-curcumene cyclase
MDALKAAGEDSDSEAIQKALIFMSRCQNLPSEHNTAKFTQVVSSDDHGGFIYSPVGEGETKAGKTPEGGLRSYASMTYAGLKSMLHAGLSKDDLRVKAALDWISRHYDLRTNPGMGPQGLYYYYHVFAKTLATADMSEVTDADGKVHNWRSDLISTLAQLQADDGSWTNSSDRWYEGDPNLVTSYALLALAYCDTDSE